MNSIVANARTSVAEILNPNSAGVTVYRENVEAEKLRKAIRASAAINEYVESVSDFITFEDRWKERLLPRDQVRTLAFDTRMSREYLTMYMECKLAKAVSR